MTEWKTIDSAPKDGAHVLLWWPLMPITFYPAVGINHDDGYGWELVALRDYGEVYPTHWMPLPQPPK